MSESRTAKLLILISIAALFLTGFREEVWEFDQLNADIRFSHGSHKKRGYWFKEKFGTGYRCEICHNYGKPGEGSLVNEEKIREAGNKPGFLPYGVSMRTCLNSCHDNITAPSNCDWCHVLGSKALKVMDPKLLGPAQ